MRANRYPGGCRECGGRVEAGAGRIAGKVGNRWTVAHLSCAEAGEAAVMVIEIGGNEYTRNRNGRCEDAPACGCCTI